MKCSFSRNDVNIQHSAMCSAVGNGDVCVISVLLLLEGTVHLILRLCEW
jgi:hypothetical protein